MLGFGEVQVNTDWHLIFSLAMSHLYFTYTKLSQNSWNLFFSFIILIVGEMINKYQQK